MVIMTVVLAAVAALFLVFLYKSLYLVQQAEAIIIERFGRFDRLLGPGIHIVIPFIERPRSVYWSFLSLGPDKRYFRYTKSVFKIDLRESVHDFPKQNVITRDNVTMEINALVYYQITDPKRAIYEVNNFPEAIEKLTQTTLRNVIGSLDLDQSLVSRDAINERLRTILEEAADKWGVKVTRVELQDVNPPVDIRTAMEKQMRAERDRRAVMIEAEGQKMAAILQAEGQRESGVLRARGIADSRVIDAQSEAESRLKIIEAEAKAIELIRSAAPNQDPLSYLAATQYIKTLPKLMEGKDNKLIILPYEATGLGGSIAAMKKLLGEVQ
ncbi:SPFH/Band 7/PHB domain protein [Candidatus Dependentiae bacterium]|nr:SPFH/Band 7/PHB domain protein [Candidatus Dependentiae bacterium]